MKCPNCNDDAYRDSVDVGVGVIHGPYGCCYCGWSQDSTYDVNKGGGFQPDGSYRDPMGGIWPAGNPVIKMMKEAKDASPQVLYMPSVDCICNRLRDSVALLGVYGVPPDGRKD